MPLLAISHWRYSVFALSVRFSAMHGRIYYSHSLPGPHDTDDILKVMGSKVKVTDSFSAIPLLYISVKCCVRNLHCLPRWQPTPASSRRRPLILHRGVSLHRTRQRLLRRRLLQVTIQQRQTPPPYCQPCCHPQHPRNNLCQSISSLTKVLYLTKCLCFKFCRWLLDSAIYYCAVFTSDVCSNLTYV